MTTMDSSGEKIASVMLKLLQSRSPYSHVLHLGCIMHRVRCMLHVLRGSTEHWIAS